MYNKQQIFEYIAKHGDCIYTESITCDNCRKIFKKNIACPIGSIAIKKEITIFEYALEQTKLCKCKKLLKKL